MTISNGLAQNGLSINGLAQNGLAQNGLAQNGLAQNGLAQNGLAQNGLAQNGLILEGFFNNDAWKAGLTGAAAIPGDILRGNANLRHLMQYLYSCAMPSTAQTVLDPNNGALLCSPSTPCPDGYTCSSDASQGTCQIPLTGDKGVGINADGTSWEESGSCDDSCQRWVSACVLARTNAFGVHVEISMRAPANVPAGREAQFQKIQAALATAPDERHDYNIREGAYYGNLFASLSGTLDSTGNFIAGGSPNNVFIMTPTFEACAGPGSNIPEITKRFTSSQGDERVINVPGLCLTDSAAVPPTPGACKEADTTPDEDPTKDGAIGDCFTSTNPTLQTTANEYREVITVYLKWPVAACGNSICEKGEDSSTNPLCFFSDGQEPCYCPSDCPPGWTKSVAPNVAGTFTDENWSSSVVRPQYDLSAVGGPDDSIAVVGMSASATGNAGLGGPLSGEGYGVIAKYASDGTFGWGVRFGNLADADASGQLQQVTGVAIAPNGNITVAGTTLHKTTNLSSFNGSFNGIWISTYSPTGALISQHSVPVVSSSSQLTPTTPVAVDSQSNAIMGGVYTGGSSAFGGCMASTCSYFVKIAVNGTVVWSENTQGIGNGNFPTSVSVGPNDTFVTLDPYVALTLRDSTGTPALGWPVTPPAENPVYGDLNDANQNIPWYGAEVTGIDSNLNVYLAGTTQGFGEGGTGVTPVHGLSPNLIKYDEFGNYQWHAEPFPTCGAGCDGGLYDVHHRTISFTHDPLSGTEEVIVGGIGHSYPGGGVNFGLGSIFQSYSGLNIYVAGYGLDKTPLWAKQFPTIPTSGLLSMAIDSQGRVVIGGTFGGSMLLDNRLVVSNVPEDPAVLNSFVGSLSTPSTSKNNAPFIGGGNTDTTGKTISTLPQSIFALATSAQGSNIFYLLPTATDDAHAGLTVSCFPAPNTTFPIGTTTVTCSAFDPTGNKSTTSFNVTVADLLGPVLSPIPDITVPATGANGAIVNYMSPTAIDQVDGTVSVSCAPASGTLFGVGKTTVTCSASDSSGNPSSTSFSVTVTPATPVSVTCLGTTAMPVIVQTAPGACGAPVSAASVGACAGGAAGLASCLLDGVATEALERGDHTVTLMATGLDASTASCTAYVRVVDGQKPAITCASQTVACTGNGGATVTPAATCTDNCSCTASCAAGQFKVGVSSGNCTASDPSGNSAGCQPAITVVDAVPPVVTPRSGPTQLQCNVDKWTDPGATALDQCVGDVSSSVRVSGAVDPTHVGTYVETYSASDPSGNLGSATRSVKVVDSLPPSTTATAGPNGTPNRLVTIAVTSYTVTPTGGGTPITGSATCWSTAGLAVSLKATDTCSLIKQLTYSLSGAQSGGATVSGGSASLAVTHAGTTTVSYHATDSAGNAEVSKTLLVHVTSLLGFGISCAPSPSIKGLPAHGTVSVKGTVTVTDSRTLKQTSQPFSFAFSY